MYHHHISFLEIDHLLARSGLTCPEVSSKVYHDFFCHLGSSISLPWVTYFEAFYLHVGLHVYALQIARFHRYMKTNIQRMKKPSVPSKCIKISYLFLDDQKIKILKGHIVCPFSTGLKTSAPT